jgi:NhaP-type Na+/H+ or K+/H+ antiporter
LNSTSRLKVFNVWESFVFILNGTVFLIIGLELPEIVEGLHEKGIPMSTAIGYGLLITGVLIAARIVSSYVALVATIIFRPSVAPRATSTTRRWLLPMVLGWTGMRGVVSLAAALAIPITLDNGTAFPQRNLILFITFIVILLTLVVQGLTLPLFIRKSGVYMRPADSEPEESSEQKIQDGLRQHVHHFLKHKYEHEMKGNAVIEKFLKKFEERFTTVEDEAVSQKTRMILLEVLESQRQFLDELNRDPKIDEEIIRLHLYQIDLEEERLKMV